MSGKTAEELSKSKKYHGGDQISPVTTVFSPQEEYTQHRTKKHSLSSHLKITTEQTHLAPNLPCAPAPQYTLLNPLLSKELSHSKNKMTLSVPNYYQKHLSAAAALSNPYAEHTLTLRCSPRSSQPAHYGPQFLSYSQKAAACTCPLKCNAWHIVSSYS